MGRRGEKAELHGRLRLNGRRQHPDSGSKQMGGRNKTAIKWKRSAAAAICRRLESMLYDEPTYEKLAGKYLLLELENERLRAMLAEATERERSPEHTCFPPDGWR